VYCLGVTLFMMLIGAPPYQAPQPQNAAFKYIISGRVADVLKHWRRLRLLTDDAVDLLTKMLCYEQHRISVADILQHPFLANVDDEVEEQKADSPIINIVHQSADNLNVDSLGNIEQKVSNMSIDDDNQPMTDDPIHSNAVIRDDPIHSNYRQKKASVNPMDHKEESIGDAYNNNNNNGQNANIPQHQQQYQHPDHMNVNLNDAYVDQQYHQGHDQGQYAPDHGGYAQNVANQNPNQHPVQQQAVVQNGNLADFQCEALLQQWGLQHCYDSLLATDWAKPAEWHDLTVHVLVWEAGLDKTDATRFMECLAAQFGVGHDHGPNNNHPPHHQQQFVLHHAY